MKRAKKIIVVGLLLACLCIGILPIPTSAVSGATKFLKTTGSTRVVLGSDYGNEYEGSPPCFDMYIYGDSYSGSGTIEDYALLNWDTINFYGDLHGDIDTLISLGLYKQTETGDELVEMVNLTQYGKQNYVMYTASNLPDGDYLVYVITHYETNFLFIYFTTEYRYGYHFSIDRTLPKITGASTSTTGKYTKSSFSVSASDANGIEGFYYKKPGETSFTKSSSTTLTFPSTGTKGRYSFYAVDKLGNRSATHYVNLDTTAPTGHIMDSNDKEVTSTYITGSFYYVATDNSAID